MIKHAKLGDVCIVKRGTTITKKNTKQGNIPVIAGGRKATYYHNKHNREAGVITISGSGASAGFVNYWTIPIFASDCSTVEVKDDKQNIKFIYYYLQSMQKFIYKNLRSGAAQPHVYSKDIAKLNFPILSIEKQKHIVTKLDTVFYEINKKENINFEKVKFIDELKDCILENKLGSDKIKLSDACDLIKRGVSPKYLETGGIPVINQKCIRNHKIDYFKSRQHDINLKKVPEERFIRKGDVLINSTGHGTLGRVAQVNQDPIEKTTVDSHVTIVRPKQKLFNLDYFGNALIKIEKQLEAAGEGTSGQTELSRSKLENEFYIPYIESTNEQRKVSLMINSMFKNLSVLKDLTVKIIENLRALKLSFLYKEINNKEV